MHTIGKHSPEVPEAALKQRAIDGTNPIDGITPKSKKGSPSSTFKTWKLQLHAINEALTRESRGLKKFTGFDKNKNPIVRIEQPGSGVGYKPNKNDKTSPVKVDGMRGAGIKFDPESKTPFTAFPVD